MSECRRSSRFLRSASSACVQASALANVNDNCHPGLAPGVAPGTMAQTACGREAVRMAMRNTVSWVMNAWAITKTTTITTPIK